MPCFQDGAVWPNALRAEAVLFGMFLSQVSCTLQDFRIARQEEIKGTRNSKLQVFFPKAQPLFRAAGYLFFPVARTKHFKESRARLYEQSWQQQVPAQEHSFIPDLRVFSWIGDWQRVKRAHGVVAPHPLRMRKALSSDPSVSTFLCETEIRQWMKSSSVFLEWTMRFLLLLRV